MARQTIDNKWGATGTATDPGSAKISAGWGAEIPPFETQNFWQLRVDDLLENIEKHGIMEWDAATTYGIGAWTKASDNESYRSLTATNTGNDPISSALNWVAFTSLVTVVTATETVKGIAEIASLIETQNGTDDSRFVTPKKLKDAIQQVVPDASTSTKGKLELASNSEAQAGTDTGRAVTPAALKSVTATETRVGLVERATDAEVTNGTDTTRYVSPKQVSDRVNVLVPQATATLQGKVELATTTEVRTGTDASRVVTPATVGSFMTGWTLPFPSATAPTGFLEAGGQLVSRTTYSDLWAWVQVNAKIVTEAVWSASDSGTYSSGDLSTTFRLPDLRGQFIRGWDNGRGIDVDRVLGSTQLDELKAHTHLSDLNSNTGGAGTGTGENQRSPSTQTQTTSSTGGTETRPRNIAWMFCIKT